MDGGRFIQFAGTISRLTGDEHPSTEDDGEDYAITFVLDSESPEDARGEARAAVGAGLQQVGLGDLEFFEVSVEPA